MVDFRVERLDISTGQTLVAVMHKKDADLYDFQHADRIKLSTKKSSLTVILDITSDLSLVKPGTLALFKDVCKILHVRTGTKIGVTFSGKPDSVEFIRDKLNGNSLHYKELLSIVKDITADRLTDIEKTYFVSACYIHGLSSQEIVDLTKAMVATGDKISFRGVTLDKHCIGGVPNNRTSMIVVPILAAAGLTIAKTSSRAITSPAGTADTMECLAKVELPQKKILDIVKQVKGCLVHGGSMNLAPADDKIILVESPMSIDAEGQLVASVMAKKYSVSATHVLIDIPMGPDVKVKSKRDARRLQRLFEDVGQRLGMHVKVIVTDGSQPIGRGVGPLLEAEDVIAVLRNDPLAPQDLRDKSILLTEHLLELAGKPKTLATELLESGAAWQKMKDIIALQGPCRKPKLGQYRYNVRSSSEGKIIAINNKIVSKIARTAGAPLDKGAGIFIHRKIGSSVQKQDILYTVYAENETKLNLAKKYVQGAYVVN